MWIPARSACTRGRPAGTRIEETELRFAVIEREIRDVIPADEIDTLIDNIGIPNSWSSLAQGDIPTISTADGEILISLKQGQARFDPRLRSDAPQAPAREVSRHDVLLPACQHHQPDFELRLTRADRPAGDRARCAEGITRLRRSWRKGWRLFPARRTFMSIRSSISRRIRLECGSREGSGIGLDAK